jgi:hypothetical protein
LPQPGIFASRRNAETDSHSQAGPDPVPAALVEPTLAVCDMTKTIPIPKACEKASERITVRFTPSERDSLIERAGTNVSAWVRGKLMANSRSKSN